MQGDFQPQLSMIRVDKPIIEIEIDLYMSAIVVHGGGGKWVESSFDFKTLSWATAQYCAAGAIKATFFYLTINVFWSQ